MEFKDYPRPNITTDIVLFRINNKETENTRRKAEKNLQVLLVKRTIEPQIGMVSLPGGFVNIDEEIKDNVKRKLFEKTGVKGSFYIEQLYTKGELDRDPRGRVISISYLGLCNKETYNCEDKLNENANWYNVYDVLNSNKFELAFDHKEILEYALERVKNKIEYTDIAFNLLPKEFTISECQDIYELILQKEILNFRRKINEYVEPLNQIRKLEGKQFRPSNIYTVKKNRDSKF